MPTATLTYDLGDPEEERAHKYALAGLDALIALEGIEQHIRSALQYRELSEETQRELREIRELVPHELIALME
jgi:hypothetical protein